MLIITNIEPTIAKGSNGEKVSGEVSLVEVPSGVLGGDCIGWVDGEG
ncbi:MAG: hypothetical protein QXV09_05460 [Candidatus Bathyarchaeia archaeon]